MFSLPSMASDTLTELSTVGSSNLASSNSLPNTPILLDAIFFTGNKGNTSNYLLRINGRKTSNVEKPKEAPQSYKNVIEKIANHKNITEDFGRNISYRNSQSERLQMRRKSFLYGALKDHHHSIQTQLIWVFDCIIDLGHQNQMIDLINA